MGQPKHIWLRGAPRLELPVPAFWGTAEDDCEGVAIAHGLSRRGSFVEALVDKPWVSGSPTHLMTQDKGAVCRHTCGTPPP